MTYWGPMPGWPGPAFAGHRSQIAPVSLPMMPGQPGAAAQGSPQAAAAPGLFEGLARAGVPIMLTPDGRPVLKTGGGNGQAGNFLPPQIAGMPSMPSPPGWMSDGHPAGGGLFKPIEPVAAFDPSSHIRQMHMGRAPGN